MALNGSINASLITASGKHKETCRESGVRQDITKQGSNDSDWISQKGGKKGC